MTPEAFAYLLPVPALMSGLLALYAWGSRRYSPGARLLAWYMLGTTLGSLGYMAELLSPGLETKLAWVGLRYLGTSGMVLPAFLLLVLWYTGHEAWLSGPRQWLIIALPAVSVLIFFSNPWHQLHYTQVWLETSSGSSMLGKAVGPLYLGMVAVMLAYFAVSLALLALQVAHNSPLQRQQALVMGVGFSLPVLATLAYMGGWRPSGLNLTPLSYVFTGLAAAWAVFGLKLFYASPAVFRLLSEKTPLGVVVLDAARRVLEVNPVAQRDLGVSGEQVLGLPLAQACAAWPELGQAFAAEPPLPGEVVLRRGAEQFYQVEIFPLENQSQPLGYLVLLHNATQRLQAEKQTLEAQRKLAALEEREALARELHDGVGQVLGFVSTQSQAAVQYLHNEQPALAQATLARLNEVVNDAHADLRDYILGMKAVDRRHVNAPAGLGPALQQYAETFSRT